MGRDAVIWDEYSGLGHFSHTGAEVSALVHQSGQQNGSLGETHAVIRHFVVSNAQREGAAGHKSYRCVLVGLT